MRDLNEDAESPRPMGFGVVDPKGDLYQRTIYLLKKRLDEPSAKKLRRRIVTIDFASTDPVSSYNILAPWPNTELDYFAFSRADM